MNPIKAVYVNLQCETKHQNISTTTMSILLDKHLVNQRNINDQPGKQIIKWMIQTVRVHNVIVSLIWLMGSYIL